MPGFFHNGNMHLNLSFDEWGKIMSIFSHYDPFQSSGNTKRGGEVRSALWFAASGKVEAMLHQETGVTLSSGKTPELLALLTYNAMENCIGFGAGRYLRRPGEQMFFGPAVRVSPSVLFSYGNWIREVLNLPFTAKEMGGRLPEAARSLEKGVNYAWDPRDEKRARFKPYGYGDIFLASDCLAQGMAIVYRGVLEASVAHLKTKGDAGAAELELGIKQSKLGDEFAQSVSKNREALVENPNLSRNYGTGTGSAPAVKVLTDHTLLAAAAVTPECALTLFTVQCGHGDRGYILDVLGGKPTYGTRYLLQVISSPSKRDKIKVHFEGHCGHGKTTCPAVQINSGNIESASPYTFEAEYRISKVHNFMDFVKRIFVPADDALHPIEYRIRTKGCSSKSYEATVHSFPTFKWNGELGLGYGYPGSKNQNKKTKANKEEKGRLYLDGKIEGNIGESKWSFKSGIDEEEEKSKNFFPKLGAAINDVFKSLDGILGEADTAQAKPDKFVKRDSYTGHVLWPKVKLGGNVELRESKGYKVGIGGDIYLKMDPLIGAEVKVDILQLLINRIKNSPYAPMGFFLEMIRDKAKGESNNDEDKNVSASAIISLDFTVRGTLEAELGWKIDPGDKEWRVTKGKEDDATGGSMKLTFGLLAELKAKAKYYFVRMSAGAEVKMYGARSKDEAVGGILRLVAKTKPDGKPGVGGQFIFTGIKIYYVFYAEISVENNETENKKKTKRGGKIRKFLANNSENIERSEKKQGEYELMKARIWPSEKTKGAKNEGKGFDSLEI